MIFVDSGFLLAFAQPTDALHRRAEAWARVIAEPLLVTEYTSFSKRSTTFRGALTGPARTGSWR
jgi:hypothetical protein